MRCMVDAKETDRSLWRTCVYKDGRMDEHTRNCFFHQRGRWCVDIFLVHIDALIHCSSYMGRALRWLEVLIPDDVI